MTHIWTGWTPQANHTLSLFVYVPLFFIVVHIIVADDLLQISISSQFLQQKELKPTICKPPREKNQANENHD